MSKKFNVQAIVHERKNELDRSPLFRAPPPTPPAQEDASPARPRHDQGDARARVPSPRASASPPPASKRAFVRRTFDFYEEQIAFLTRESLEGRLAGKEVSMNAMVREAIDDWIKKKTSTK
jgi:hypothetical protein